MRFLNRLEKGCEVACGLAVNILTKNQIAWRSNGVDVSKKWGIQITPHSPFGIRIHTLKHTHVLSCTKGYAKYGIAKG